MAPFSRRVHTTAIVAHLEAGFDGEALIGSGVAPEAAGWQGQPGASAYVPAVIVDSIDVRRNGPLDGSDSWAELIYQLTAVGSTVEQAEAAIDLAVQLIYDDTLAVTGRTVETVMPDLSDGARRDDDVEPPIWTAIERFAIWTSPA